MRVCAPTSLDLYEILANHQFHPPYRGLLSSGGRLLKVGVNRAQRVFDAKPDGSGASFTLVRIEMRGDD